MHFPGPNFDVYRPHERQVLFFKRGHLPCSRQRAVMQGFSSFKNAISPPGSAWRAWELLDMLFAKIVQYPVAHFFRCRHGKLGDAHRIEDRTHPLFRFQAQRRFQVRAFIDCLLIFWHGITPDTVCAEPGELCRQMRNASYEL